MSTAKRGIRWDGEPLMGRVPDRVLGEKHGCTKEAVGLARKARGIPAFTRQRADCDPSVFAHEFDGRTTDAEIADRHGLTPNQVACARRKLGKPSWRILWRNSEHAALLGRAADAEIARRLRLPLETVISARQRLGIAPWMGTEQRRCPCGTTFNAVHGRQRYCSYRCQRYHWQLVKEGMPKEAADCAIAVWAYKRTMKEIG